MTGNSEIYIIGGGSSLTGFDFSRLKGRDTIAVNMAALDVPSPTYCITADSNIFKKLCEGYFKGVDTTWVLVTNPNHCSMKWKDGRFIGKSGYVYDLFKPNMIIRNAGVEGIGFSFNDFRTGYNSGFCAFQLAVLLGYRKICLLGFDMTIQKTQSHYHDRYKGKRIADATLDQYYDNFALALATLNKKTNIEVVSCSKISRLNRLIPYQPFLHSTMHIGRDDTPKKFSVLICSLKQRHKTLNRLLKILTPQRTDDVEILIEIDEGSLSIGAKRNLLLKQARGDYIAFIDDDDKVSVDYISKILKALKTKPDCCGIEGTITSQRRSRKRKFIHSKRYDRWFEEGGMYFRCPNHLSPVKRSLALQVGFPDTNKGEDKEYSMKLFPLLKREVYITDPIYFYLTG